jgi:S-adenosylmethionine decarboxylase
MTHINTARANDHFGEHLTIDGYFGDSERLKDREIVRRSIDELPAVLGMKKLSATEVYFARGNDLKDAGGWSGFVVIEESHISVHTFPAVGFVSIDVYTCRNGLDRQRIVNYFGDRFGLQEFEVNFIKRGLKFPEATRCRMEG